MKYDIWRFYADDRGRKFIKTVPSLLEAQKHCTREDTHKPGEWFDGYNPHNHRAVELEKDN